MKRKVCVFSLLAVLVGIVSGCATSTDLNLLRTEMDMRTTAVEEKSLSQVQAESAALRKELKQANETVAKLRQTDAELRADMSELRDQIRQLRGILETQQKDVGTLQGRANAENRDLKERVSQLAFKVGFMENFLGIGKKDERHETMADRLEARSNGKNDAMPAKSKNDKESLYAQAYESFKEGKYEKARNEFQTFLKAYPDTEYSGNAQFWIGECYYFEKKYEKAILEYEKVIKNYPEGNKVPYALLKQGLSFQSLGDKASARAILQNIIKDYPNTNQARIARSKLLEMR
jgi:tol-pal system protein YbgF